jgi:threonine dehydrogenase-like Zn-dependent dehydrogenase
MLALRFEENRLSVADVARPTGEDEALVRVTLSGICNTDLEIVRGYAGFEGTIGHEFVGVLESAPSGPLKVGQRVVGEINAGCGSCHLCAQGDARHCPRRTVLGIVGRDGAHAEFLRLPVANLLAVPPEVPDRRAVFTEPLAAACGILERVPNLTKEMRVAVIGDGKLGLLCAQVLALAGAPTLLVGRHAEKLRIASARGIETATIEEASKRPRSFDVAVEASGAESGFELALSLLVPRGTLVLKSTFHGETRINAARMVVDEISVVGSRCGRFAPALELLRRGAVDVESLVSEEYKLSDGLRAMQRAAARGVLKVLLKSSHE